jgi:hypothetical protein
VGLGAEVVVNSGTGDEGGKQLMWWTGSKAMDVEIAETWMSWPVTPPLMYTVHKPHPMLEKVTPFSDVSYTFDIMAHPPTQTTVDPSLQASPPVSPAPSMADSGPLSERELKDQKAFDRWRKTLSRITGVGLTAEEFQEEIAKADRKQCELQREQLVKTSMSRLNNRPSYVATTLVDD